ncbi:hypothetical protein AQJ67_05445 [Streptomyces caeruleatus]|uniref:Transposase IS701-like DDE domain-containing protein n=1 Tax=Streptomyces caeruleatus TaxID=661399 RepID=A0A101U7P5_9ACTN|nr:hypothetical protein AQJ67_05445 [Streptomyces caeruleatus]
MFEALMGRIAGRFARLESRRRRGSSFSGWLMSDLPRKYCWTLAEHAGYASPDGLQHLLSRTKWDADASATTSAVSSSSTPGATTRCWSSTRPAT